MEKKEVSIEEAMRVLESGSTREFSDTVFTAKILEIFDRVINNRTEQQIEDLAKRAQALEAIEWHADYTDEHFRFTIPSKNNPDHALCLEVKVVKMCFFRSHETKVTWHFVQQVPGETLSSIGYPDSDWLETIEAYLTKRYSQPLADIERAIESAKESKKLHDIIHPSSPDKNDG